MNTLRSGHRTKKAFIAVMLCSLLFQIQTVFACQMMDHSGPIEHCCCDDMTASKNSDKALEKHSNCCDIDTKLTVKAVDADKDEPALVSQPSLDPPLAALVVLLITLWPEFQASPSPIIWDLEADPGHPGTQTYLSTLRLRI